MLPLFKESLAFSSLLGGAISGAETTPLPVVDDVLAKVLLVPCRQSVECIPLSAEFLVRTQVLKHVLLVGAYQIKPACVAI